MTTNVLLEHPWMSPTALVLLEPVQALAPVIGRSCDTTDWTSNTIGAVVGAVLGWVATRHRTARPAGPSTRC